MATTGGGLGGVLGEAQRLLRARGQRMTAPRRAVLAALSARGGHVGAEQVVTDVAATGVHRSSVYRTLEALTGLGVLQHVHLVHGGTVYHPVGAYHPHGQCSRCGEVVDLPAGLAHELETVVRERSGFAVDVTHVALPGTCAGCAG